MDRRLVFTLVSIKEVFLWILLIITVAEVKGKQKKEQLKINCSFVGVL